MGLIDLAKDTIKDLPISEVQRERLSLALDQSAMLERQVGELQTKIGGLEAQLERERLDHQETKQKLQGLEDSVSEEMRFVDDVEFRKGIRTANEWRPFCPKCHLPLTYPARGDFPFVCADRNCGWASQSSCSATRSEMASSLR